MSKDIDFYIEQNRELHNRLSDLQDQLSYIDERRKEFIERIDKAIEYIKKYGLYEELTDYDENDNLIITGVSDEKTTKDLLEILGEKE